MFEIILPCFFSQYFMDDYDS